jgi:hypothetical protein
LEFYDIYGKMKKFQKFSETKKKISKKSGLLISQKSTSKEVRFNRIQGGLEKPVTAYTLLSFIGFAFEARIGNFGLRPIKFNQNIDIVTTFNSKLSLDSPKFASGFDIHCENTHYLSIEGPTNGIISDLWAIPRNLDENTAVLYDSSLLFSKRQYKMLDRTFSELRLDFILENVLLHGILHCQASSPKVILNGLLKLSEYSKIGRFEKLYSKIFNFS